MRSDQPSSRPPTQPPNQPAKRNFKVETVRSNFVFGAAVAALVMSAIAFALGLHAYQNNKWVEQMKADATSRAHAPKPPAPMTSDASACPDAKPVLTGFDGQGKPKCRAVAAQTCGDGQYISSIDPLTLEIHCSDAGGDVSCPSNAYVTEFMWLGEQRTSYSCNLRLDPFLAWKFEPSLGSRGND